MTRPLHAATRAGQIKTTRMILHAGADPNAPLFGRPPLFNAIGDGDRAIAELLIEFGADLEFRDTQWDSTPLGWAVFFGSVVGTRLANELGAKIAPKLVGLAEAGQRGELRRWSSGRARDYQEVAELIRERFDSK